MSENTEIQLAQEETISKFDNFQHLEQIEALANTLLKSRILPDAYKTPEAVIATVIYGKELGISAMIALQNINFIAGKPCLGIHIMQALGRRAGVDSVVIKDLEPIYDSEGKHVDSETVIRFYRFSTVLEKVIEEDVSFRWSDAIAAQLTGKDNWKKYPKDMTYSRCYSKGLRRFKPEAITGLYTIEEMASATNTKVEMTEEGHITIVQ